jgi:hypothetical protein
MRKDSGMTDEPQAGDDLIRRLLGSAAPEVGCEECFEELDRFVELELSGVAADSEIPGMRPHLDGCPACHEDYLSLRALVEAER